MAALLYQLFSSSAMASIGLYHLISITTNHFRSPRDYFAKPFHSCSLLSSSPSSQRFFSSRNLPIYLIILCLLISFFHQTLISTYSDPLFKGRNPVHRFTSLQSAAVVLLFLILALALLLSKTTSLLPFPPDLFFGLASAFFFLQYSVSSSSAELQISDLQTKCDSVSARISASSCFFCLVLACLPRLFVADVCLGASMLLQGLWALQTGLSLYADSFIPEGCNKLLDVVSGVEGSTMCDSEDAKMRAVAILDLIFLLQVFFVLLIVLIIYAVVVKTIGIKSRFGSNEALPTVTTSSTESNHVQMKGLTGTQA